MPAGAPAAALMLQRAARGSQLGVCPSLGMGTLPSPLLTPGSSHAAGSLQPLCLARPGLLLPPASLSPPPAAGVLTPLP